MAANLWKKWKKRQSQNVIEKPIQKRSSTNRKINKILLLGAGNSGKRTIYKVIINLHQQYMTHIHNNFDKDTRESFDIYNGKKPEVIRQNCVACILKLLKQSQAIYDKNNIIYSKCLVDLNDQTIHDIQLIVAYGPVTFENYEKNNDSFEALGQAIDRIWKLEAIEETWKLSRNGMYSCVVNMDYFLDKITTIMSKNYQPTKEDRLKERVRTTGVCRFWYECNDGNPFSLYLTGGQRNERKKWIHTFEGTKCVIFVVGLDHFCKVLFEDESKNALMEDIELWEEIANYKWFKNTKMVLILNKIDLFYECLKCNSLKVCFGEEYKGQIVPQQRYKPIVYDLNVSKRIIQLACKYGDKDILLSADIIGLLMTYYSDYPYKWDMAWLDGIEFIKNNVLRIRPNITIYELCAVNMENVNAVIEDIQQQLVNSDDMKQSVVPFP